MKLLEIIKTIYGYIYYFLDYSVYSVYLNFSFIIRFHKCCKYNIYNIMLFKIIINSIIIVIKM